MKKIVLVLILSSLLSVSFVGINKTGYKTEWMKGNYGLMVHWLAPSFTKPSPLKPDGPLPLKGDFIWDLNKAVNAFDIPQFMKDFDKTGAEWLIFTIGQNTGTYASPNSIIDSLAGPGHTPNRDLVLEIAKAVKHRGKKFIVYLPCEIKKNTTLHAGLEWTIEPGTDQAAFQKNYVEIIREWSERYGAYVDGWWFDGCYPSREPFTNNHMKWEDWYGAARAGNKNAVITFNDGSFLTGNTEPIRPEHDYTSGEALVLVDSKIRLTTQAEGSLFMPKQAYVKGTKCLYHTLLPIDGYWAHNGKKFPEWANVPFKFEPSKMQKKMPDPIYQDAELIKFVDDFTTVGGAVTLNVNVTQEGFLGKKTIKQLKALKKSRKIAGDPLKN